MCGIYVTVAQNLSGCLTNDSYTQRTSPEWLLRRGPDGCHHKVIRSYFSKSPGTLQQNVFVQATIFASVLRMRSVYVQQPVDLLNVSMEVPESQASDSNGGEIDSKGCAYFSWNGEVYEFFNIENDSVEPAFSHKISDTSLVCKLLLKQVAFSDTTILQQQQQIATVMGQLINAEYAFCIATTDCIFYGRDIFGRRSLLTGASEICSNMPFQRPHWCVSSVAESSFLDADVKWEEVRPGLVHAYELKPKSLDPLKVVESIPIRMPCSLCFGATAKFSQLANQNGESETVSQFHLLLLEAVRRRCGETRSDPSDQCCSTETAVLFSGGLDSAVVAALALEAGVSLLTLLTVSFIDHNDAGASSVPAADAVAAKQTYLELCQLYPNSKIKLVHRIVDWNDVVSAEAHLRILAFPKTDSVMDVNIATALWFASSAADKEIDDMPPRILLSGLGADELLGGYGRHRTAWNRGGYDELQKELTLDVDRLWERNLGRDDRILSDTGKEVRFPFLDVNIVRYIQQLPLECVVDYTMDVGKGDKRILRLVAEQIGLKAASCAVKRAIQFGSRISHVSDKQRFGSRRKANCTTKEK
jgi:asparagine synthetase B (glutamine-hydrolysing)